MRTITTQYGFPNPALGALLGLNTLALNMSLNQELRRAAQEAVRTQNPSNPEAEAEIDARDASIDPSKSPKTFVQIYIERQTKLDPASRPLLTTNLGSYAMELLEFVPDFLSSETYRLIGEADLSIVPRLLPIVSEYKGARGGALAKFLDHQRHYLANTYFNTRMKLADHAMADFHLIHLLKLELNAALLAVPMSLADRFKHIELCHEKIVKPALKRQLSSFGLVMIECLLQYKLNFPPECSNKLVDLCDVVFADCFGLDRSDPKKLGSIATALQVLENAEVPMEEKEALLGSFRQLKNAVESSEPGAHYKFDLALISKHLKALKLTSRCESLMPAVYFELFKTTKPVKSSSVPMMHEFKVGKHWLDQKLRDTRKPAISE